MAAAYNNSIRQESEARLTLMSWLYNANAHTNGITDVNNNKTSFLYQSD